jgi:hypothetical protein
MTFRISETQAIDCDAYLTEPNLVATADFAAFRGAVSCDIWVSGMTEDNGLVVLLRVQTGLGKVSESEALEELNKLFDSHLRSLAEGSRTTGGIVSTHSFSITKDRERMCAAHLDLHSRVGTIGQSLGIKHDIARQFQLVKSLGLASAKPFLARRLNLPLSTISRRIWMAQELGLLPKVSAAADMKEQQ